MIYPPITYTDYWNENYVLLTINGTHLSSSISVKLHQLCNIVNFSLIIFSVYTFYLWLHLLIPCRSNLLGSTVSALKNDHTILSFLKQCNFTNINHSSHLPQNFGRGSFYCLISFFNVILSCAFIQWNVIFATWLGTSLSSTLQCK